MKRRWTILLSLMLAALMFTGCAAAETADLPQERPSAETLSGLVYDYSTWSENPSFQSFNGVTLTGEAVNQDILSGHKVTMLNIWATFCNPCIMEMPDLGALNKAYGEGEFQVIGLVVDTLDQGSVSSSAIDLAWEIIDLTGADYMHLLPSYDLSVVKLNDVMSVPETVFLDSEGNILNPETQYLGARSYDDWKAIIDELLAQQA